MSAQPVLDAHAAKTFLDECERALSSLDSRLARALHDREGDFLRLGEVLQDFAAHAGDIAEDARGLVGLTSESAMADFRNELHDELDKMTSLWSRAASEENVKELGVITETVETLTKTIGEYRRVVRALSMLGIATRIESARLGAEGRGFTTLADDVEKLAKRIVVYSDQVLEKVGELSTLAGSAIEETDAMREQQQATSHTIEHAIRANLDKLVGLAATSNEVSQQLEPLSLQTAERVGEAVASLQFHDIVRQQVEHVEESLHDMRALMKEERHKGPEAVHELVAWIGDVTRLESSQLENASGRFADAVENLKTQLAGIAEGALGIEQAAGELAGGEESGDTTLAAIEAGLADVMEAMRAFARQGEAVGGMMRHVADTVGEMTHFLEDIEEVGSEIELISLNASVKAAHTGEKGKPLGVLALSIQSLSQQAGGLTQNVTEILDRTSVASEQLKQNAQSFLDTSQVEEMVTRLGQLLKGLKNINEEVLNLLSQIRKESRKLAASVEGVTAQLDFHEDVARTLEKARAVLAELADKALTLAPHESDEKRPERLQKLLERYTMEVERLIHTQASGHADHAHDASRAEDSDDPEIWGDVELF